MINRTELAGYTLLASAFVLTAILFVQVSQYSGNEAHAEMVARSGSVTMLTTNLRSEEDLVYLLDSQSQQLLVYKLDATRHEIQLMSNGKKDIGALFGNNSGRPNSNNRPR